jgi:SAM-dependent methyltransferase
MLSTTADPILGHVHTGVNTPGEGGSTYNDITSPVTGFLFGRPTVRNETMHPQEYGELASPLARNPIDAIDGIPIFSRSSRYIETYQEIARDHLAAMAPGVENPWIPGELWRELEDSTKSLIHEFALDGQRILDVGVGLGRTLKDFTNLDRHGIDISVDYLKLAREAGIDAIFSRIEDMPYRDDSFDIVVTCDVLEHVFDLHRCCAQIVRVLKPGGILIVRVPNRENLAAYLNPELPYETVHVRNFDEWSVRLLFSRIFGCEFLKASGAGYYVQGAERLRLRLLSDDNPLSRMLEAEPMRNDSRMEILKRASAVKEQDLVNWILALKGKDPEAFAQVAPHLVLPMDINVAFRKPGRLAVRVSGGDVPEPVDEAGSDEGQADAIRLSTLLGELRGAYRNERQDLLAEIERLRKVYGEDRETLVTEIGRLNKVYGDDRQTLVAEIERLNQVHSEDRDRLLAEIERQTERQRLLAEIQRLNEVYGGEIERLHKVYGEEIQLLRGAVRFPGLRHFDGIRSKVASSAVLRLCRLRLHSALNIVQRAFWIRRRDKP